jgi:hypothetical protein
MAERFAGQKMDVTLRSVLGQVVFQTTIKQNTKKVSQEIVLPNDIAAGVYQLQLAGGGEAVGATVVIRK